MRQINHSVQMMLSHSWITLAAIGLIFIIFALSQIGIYLDPTNGVDKAGAFRFSLLMNIVTSFFIGVYAGGALLALQQNYLWKINTHYKNSLLCAFLLVITYASLLQAAPFYINLDRSLAFLLAPFCISVFTAQIVLINNLLLRLIIPAVPFAIAQLYWLGVDELSILNLIIIATAGLIYFQFKSTKMRTLKPEDLLTITSTQSTLIKSTFVAKFNFLLGKWVSHWLNRYPKNVSWSVLLPQSKMGIIAAFYCLIITGFMLIIGERSAELFESFSLLYIAANMVSIVIESSQQIKQVRFYAHIYAKNKHRQLKSQILMAMDKAIVTNALIFVAGTSLAAQVLNFDINYAFLVPAFAATVGIALIFQPLLMSVGWKRISFTQITLVTIYAALVYAVNHWIHEHYASLFSGWQLPTFIASLLALRWLSQSFYWYRSLELLTANR